MDGYLFYASHDRDARLSVFLKMASSTCLPCEDLHIIFITLWLVSKEAGSLSARAIQQTKTQNNCDILLALQKHLTLGFQELTLFWFKVHS